MLLRTADYARLKRALFVQIQVLEQVETEDLKKFAAEEIPHLIALGEKLDQSYKRAHIF